MDEQHGTSGLAVAGAGHPAGAFPLAPTGDPTALWKGTIAQIISMKCGHDRMHLERIRQWLAALPVEEDK